MKAPHRQLAFLALGAALAVPALAAPETYVIDPTHSYPRFSYSHFGYSTQQGTFGKTSGKIVLDRAAKSGSVDVQIDMKAVNTGLPLFDEHIQGPDFFDTANFPSASFKSSKLNWSGDKLASVDGQLTLKGVTRPVTLEITSFQCMPHPMLKKEACGANATATVKRSEFNAGKYAPHVSDTVTLNIAVEAVRE
ncbi:YceI family protein [Azovibrio restrictus]|uniref:YceI family protein n=1 Tax=Azovibrio restrictus TaxID=146938 RepID=UPI00041EAA8B|nr:YceI family protein [Azovibrio restrictus]